jgi:predicted ATPase
MSGVSRSLSLTGGFTVIRYFSRKPPDARMFFRSESIFFAAATLS